MSWLVDFESDVKAQIAKALKGKGLSDVDIKLMKRWVTEVEEHGLKHAQKNSTWRDHELKRGKWKGHRAISISYGGRLIYRIEDKRLIVIVVRITPNHDYK